MITAEMVKELRERTGAGMMDCKKSLIETDGNMEKAIDYLREKGLAAAAKKSGRVAAGCLFVFSHGLAGVLLEAWRVCPLAGNRVSGVLHFGSDCRTAVHRERTVSGDLSLFRVARLDDSRESDCGVWLDFLGRSDGSGGFRRSSNGRTDSADPAPDGRWYLTCVCTHVAGGAVSKHSAAGQFAKGADLRCWFGWSAACGCDAK